MLYANACSNMLSYNMQISSQATQMGIQWYIEIQTTFFLMGHKTRRLEETIIYQKCTFANHYTNILV